MLQTNCARFILEITLVSASLIGCGSSNIVTPPPSGGGTSSTMGIGGAGNKAGASSGVGASGFQVGTGGNTGTSSTVDCNGPNPPVSCTLQAPPGCGDGKVNQATEQCDDGNTLAGDGCSGTCQVEPNHVCPPTGGACTVSYRCGDGVVNPGEVCD